MMPSAYLLAAKRRDFATRYRIYRANEMFFDPSHPLTIYLNADLGEDRKKINTLAAWLMLNDPKFPKGWTPL